MAQKIRNLPTYITLGWLFGAFHSTSYFTYLARPWQCQSGFNVIFFSAPFPRLRIEPLNEGAPENKLNPTRLWLGRGGGSSWGALSCDGSGPLTRVGSPVPCHLGFRAVLIFRYEFPLGWLATLCRTKRIAYRVYVGEMQSRSRECLRPSHENASPPPPPLPRTAALI